MNDRIQFRVRRAEKEPAAVALQSTKRTNAETQERGRV